MLLAVKLCTENDLRSDLVFFSSGMAMVLVLDYIYLAKAMYK